MAGFILRKGFDEDDVDTVQATGTLTVVIGDLLMISAIGSTAVAVATASTSHWQMKWVAKEAATTSEALFKATRVHPNQLWEVESANDSNVAHNGDRMLLTDKDTVNNTGTDNTSKEAVVIQVGTLGAVGDKRILVRFFSSTGVNPDAT